MKIGIVIPLWRRPALTRLTLRRCARATHGDKDCILVAVTTERKNSARARDYGFEVVSAPNVPLSDKKNAGVKHLQGRVDAVLFLGSDDWIVSTAKGQTVLDRYRRFLERYPCFGPLDLWYANLQTGTAGYWKGFGGRRRGEPSGAGRALRSDVLDALDWLPRPSGLALGHDAAMRKKLRKAGFRLRSFSQAKLGVKIIDIKSDVSTTPYHKMILDPVTWSIALRRFPATEVRDLRGLLLKAPVTPTPSPKTGVDVTPVRKIHRPNLPRKNPNEGRDFGAQRVGSFNARTGVRRFDR